MKKIAIASVLVALSCVSAFGADLPARVYTKAPRPVVDPSVNWSGFYVGAHAGYLWGISTVIDNGVVTASNEPTNGFVGGVLGGYNWQNGPLVLGIDADIGWSNAHGNGARALEFYQYDVKWTSHVRGRAGYATGSWLFFVAGGVAITDFDLTMIQAIPQQMVCGGIYTGWSVGGGAEYAFNNSISGRLEYLYDDFGKKTYVMAVNDSYQAGFTAHTLRAAISFKFPPN